MRVFENRVQMRIFEHEKEKGRRLRKLHNEELHSVDTSPNAWVTNRD
jgi:hypothetical protein